MRYATLTVLAASAAMLAACSPSTAPEANAVETTEQVVLRNLVETDVARPDTGSRLVEGDLIPTPSDSASRYYLLRTRKTANDTVIAIVRQERGDRVAYAATEVDCPKGLLHVVGVAPTRGRVETNAAHDGPLRPVKGLPLRQELGSFVCQQIGQTLGST